MRIWSIHPKYLDKKGLGGVWCETLLAKAVLSGKTKGYTHHPQLIRFRQSADALAYISTYLKAVHEEATRRGLNYDETKIGNECRVKLKPLPVTKGQLDYEWQHLVAKLRNRSPEWLKQIESDFPAVTTNPIFEVTEGEIESWEVTDVPATGSRKRKNTQKKSRSNGETESQNSDVKTRTEEPTVRMLRSRNKTKSSGESAGSKSLTRKKPKQ